MSYIISKDLHLCYFEERNKLYESPTEDANILQIKPLVPATGLSNMGRKLSITMSISIWDCGK